MGKQEDRAAGWQAQRLEQVPRLALMLLGLYVPAAVNAGEAHAMLSVSVTVPPVARLTVLSPAPVLQISPQDLRRGFVDVLQPMQLSVYSNARSGYALEIVPLTPLVQSIAVHGMSDEAQLGAEGGRIVQHWDRPQTAALNLTFRLGLAPGVAPGVYDWPLHLSVQPLESAP